MRSYSFVYKSKYVKSFHLCFHESPPLATLINIVFKRQRRDSLCLHEYISTILYITYRHNIYTLPITVVFW